MASAPQALSWKVSEGLIVCEWELSPESDADMDSLSGLSDEGALCSRWLCVAAALLVLVLQG